MSGASPFYEVSLPEDDDYEPYGVAYFPGSVLHLLPNSFSKVTRWAVPRPELRDGGYFDCLANNAGARLLSEKLCRFIDSHRTQDDPLQWLPVSVVLQGESRDYRILHFVRDLQPLHHGATEWIGGWYPRIPVIRKELIQQHRVFGLHPTGYSFLVSDDMQKLLQQEFEGCFTFRPLSAA